MTTAQTTRTGYQDYYVLEDYGMTPAEVQARHDAACELIHNLQADRDRLRAALQQIVKRESKFSDVADGETILCGIGGIARAALAQSADKGE